MRDEVVISPIRVWDATTGQFQDLEWIEDDFVSKDDEFALSTNGQYLAVSSLHSRCLKIWDTTQGLERSRRTIVHRRQPAPRILFLSETLFAWANDSTIHIEDVWGGSRVELPCAGGVSFLIACSGKNPRLVSTTDDRVVQFWDVASGQCLQQFEDSAVTPASRAVVSDDGSMFLRQDADQNNATLELWSIVSRQCLKLEGMGRLSASAFSPDGEWLATSSSDKSSIRIWSTSQGTQIKVLGEPSYVARFMSFCPNSQRLLTIGPKYGVARVYDVATSLEEHDDSDTHLNSTQQRLVAFSPNGQWLCSVEANSPPRIMNSKGEEYQSSTAAVAPTGGIFEGNIVFSRDGSKIAVASSQNPSIEIWEVSPEKSSLTLKIRQSYRDNSGNYYGAASFSDDGEFVASITKDKLFVWSLRDGKYVTSFSPPKIADTRSRCTFEFIPPKFIQNDVYLATVVGVGHIAITDTRDRVHKTLRGESSGITALETTTFKGSEYLISWSSEDIQIWDITDLRSIQLKHTLQVQGVVFNCFRDADNPARVHTNLGVLDLDEVLRRDPGSGQEAMRYSWRGCGLSGDPNWITKDGKKTLCLPKEHRPFLWYWGGGKVSVWGDRMAIASKMGRLLVLHFNDDENVWERKEALCD